MDVRIIEALSIVLGIVRVVYEVFTPSCYNLTYLTHFRSRNGLD